MIYIKCNTLLLMLLVLVLAIAGGLAGYQALAVINPKVPVLEETAPIDLPILMYHSILKDPNRAGKYVLSPQQFEDDLIYLKEQGYTTIFLEDLINYVEKDLPIPTKPIIITFDDGYYNNYHYALPLLKKHQVKAVISPICYQSELFSNKEDPNPNYAHLTWGNLQEMTGSGLVEVQNHSYNLHDNNTRKGAKIKAGESPQAYAEVFTGDTEKSQALLKEKLNITPTTYTYPFGAYCQESEELVKKMGFKASLITCDKNNLITKDPACLYKLNRYNRPANISTQEFMKRIQPATSANQESE